MIWPDVDHGHIWGFATLGIIILVLIIGAWREGRLDDEAWERRYCPECGSAHTVKHTVFWVCHTCGYEWQD